MLTILRDPRSTLNPRLWLRISYSWIYGLTSSLPVKVDDFLCKSISPFWLLQVPPEGGGERKREKEKTSLLSGEWQILILYTYILKAVNYRASLVVLCLRICLPMQGIWVQSLVQEDPTRGGASKSLHHNYWACGHTGPAPQQEKARAQERRPSAVINN